MHPYDSDKLNEECGVFAVYNHKNVAELCCLGLHALQHRGQETAGIVVVDDNDNWHKHYTQGLVGSALNTSAIIDALEGTSALGHVRYTTSGEKKENNNCYQPIFGELSCGKIAIAHNGNLVNAKGLRQKLISQGCIFNTTMDTEVIIHLIAISQKTSIEDRIIEALEKLKGGYSLVIATKDKFYAIRDPRGFRPLQIGKLGKSNVIASESCAFDIIGAKLVRDVKPGEMITIDRFGVRSNFPLKKEEERFCIFEYIYFARPDSILNNLSVYQVRKAIGSELAKEFRKNNDVDIDIVVPVPDSGVSAALGVAEELNKKFEYGLIRNHYVGRTFIAPKQKIRDLSVKLKHNVNKAVVSGKKILLIDDSIVRGTTSKQIVNLLKNAGAKEIHFLVSSPPTINPCFYGVDTPEKEQLIASHKDNQGICDAIGADSLTFISIAGLYKAVNKTNNNGYCDACFTGKYPIL